METKTDEFSVSAGHGVLVDRIAGNHIFRGIQKANNILPSWKITYGVSFFSVGFGTVNGIQPTINGATISGDDQTGSNYLVQPKIKIDGYDSEGRTWGALAVTIDPKTGLISKTANDPVTIVNITKASNNEIINSRKNVFLSPLVLITERGFIHKISNYDLQFSIGYPIQPSGGSAAVPFGFFW